MPSTEMHDSWKTGSGLPDDIDITVTDVRWEFGEPFKRQDGVELDEQCRAVFVYEDEDGEDGELFLNCGKGWEPGPKGNSVVREDGKKKAKFNHNTPFGYWIRHAAELDGVSEAMGKQDITTKEPWIGTKWHIMRAQEELNIRGEKTVFERVYPSAFLSPPKKTSKSQAASTAKATTSKNTKNEEAEEGADEKGVDNSAPSGKLLTKLKNIAAEHDNHEDFAGAALELDEISSNTDLTNWVMDEDNYTTLREE